MRVSVIQQTSSSCHRSNKICSPGDQNKNKESGSEISNNQDHLQEIIKKAPNPILGGSLTASVKNVENLRDVTQLRENICEETLAGISSDCQVISQSPSSSASACFTTPVHSQQYSRKTTPFRSFAPRVEPANSTITDSSTNHHNQSDSPGISCLPPLLPSLPVRVLPPSLISAVQEVFSSLPNNKVTPSTAELLCKVLDLPVLLDSCLLHCVYGQQMEGNCASLLSFWQQHSNLMYGKSRLFHLINGCHGSNVVKAVDLTRLVRRLLSYHPQLEFFWCDTHSGMHAPYINSVVSSILWHAGGWRRGEVNLRQFISLNLEAIIDMLQDPSQDLNLVPHFSYDQFYVAYVKFVHLDTSACGSLGPMELMDFEGGGQLGIALVERVFSRILFNCPMQFSDWVFFLLAQVGQSL